MLKYTINAIYWLLTNYSVKYFQYVIKFYSSFVKKKTNENSFECDLEINLLNETVFVLTFFKKQILQNEEVKIIENWISWQQISIEISLKPKIVIFTSS